MKRIYFTGLLFIFLAVFGFSAPVQETHSGGEAEEEFNASSFILEHISDSHEWHIMTKKNGEHVSLQLPVILYSKGSGLHVFSSKKLAHGHEYNGFRLEQEGDLEGRIVKVKSDGTVDMDNMPLDFSITKTVLGMMAAALIGLWLFLALARSYKKTGISHPKGIQGFLEPIVLFVRDDIAIPNIGEKKAEKFMPYLLSVFIFILINNLMGLVPFPPPFGANVTGTIAITLGLALFTFFMIQLNGN